jgi:SpoVK/Ycf46/Vps4 family AAA+-type ATPase
VIQKTNVLIIDEISMLHDFRLDMIDEVCRVVRETDVPFETVGDAPLVFWKGWRPFIMRVRVPESNAAAIMGGSYNTNQTTITFLRGTFDPDAIVAAALEAYNDARHNHEAEDDSRFRVIRQTGVRSRKGDVFGREGQATPATARAVDETDKYNERLLIWSKSDLGQIIPEDPLSAIAMTPDMEALVRDVRRWLDSKSWFENKRIPWRMGALCHGAPGTGKSTFIRALAQTLGLPVYVYDLATFDNSQLTRAWQDMLGSAPCIALLEDIDAVFHGRDNVTNGEDGDGVTFDCLLNLISGVGDASGVMVVVTTNRLEFLDDALGRPDPNRKGVSTRPGRIDRVVEFPQLTEAGRRTIAERILADCPDEVDAIVAKCVGYSGAQLEDACTRVALQHYWGGKEEESCSKCVDSTSTETEIHSRKCAS